MDSHQTLTELAQDREVRKAAGFRKVAERLDAPTLARLYRRQRETAPRRAAAGKKTLGGRDGTLPKRGARRPEDQLAIALVNHARQAERPLALPSRLPGDDPGDLALLDYHVPLKEKAEDLPGLSAPARVDLVGAGPESRLAVVMLKYLPPSATRGATGDTPLRALLEGLAWCAVLDASAEALRAEAAEAFGVELAAAPPLLYLVGSPRYWELCRRREAQKGAAWIQQMERLARVLDEGDPKPDEGDDGEGAPSADALGIAVRFLALALEGEPAWEVRDGRPELLAPPRLNNAWESTAGRIRPKARPRPKAQASEPAIVEPDLSRPVRSYSVGESYAAGDRIQHPTLGLGVVQAVAGPTKIEVLFDGEKRVLVHDRPSPGAA